MSLTPSKDLRCKLLRLGSAPRRIPSVSFKFNGLSSLSKVNFCFQCDRICEIGLCQCDQLIEAGTECCQSDGKPEKAEEPDNSKFKWVDCE